MWHRPQWTIITLAFLVLLTSTPAAVAQSRDRALTGGLAAGVGAGNESAGLGGHALYYWQMPDERWRLVPHAGVGWYGKVQSGNWEGRAALAGGLMTSFGRRHRLVIDVLGAPYGVSNRNGRKPHLFWLSCRSRGRLSSAHPIETPMFTVPTPETWGVTGCATRRCFCER
ncbi:MAG: hypothetical protein JWN04_1459, partial [Myxococcaceae bacterium]|nr:hypothetical protein [Myxococcaceae bacterium]